MKVADIGALVTKGETPLITDFVSAKGTYAARLILNQGKVSRTFESPYPCPKCGKKLRDGPCSCAADEVFEDPRMDALRRLRDSMEDD